MKNPFDKLNSVINSTSAILLTINIGHHGVTRKYQTRIS